MLENRGYHRGEIRRESHTINRSRCFYLARINRHSRPCCMHQFLRCLSGKRRVNPRYVVLLLAAVYNNGVFFNFEGKTSGLKNLQLEAAYKAIPIENVDKMRQDIMVAVLDSIHRKLAINRAINQNLRARRVQRESWLSLCRAATVNADISPNLPILDRSSGVAGIRRAA